MLRATSYRRLSYEMFDLHENAYPLLIGFVASLGTSALIVGTKRWHGTHSFDTSKGPQKFHNSLVPRIGGLAIFAGFFVAASVTHQPVRHLLFATGMSGILAFLSGLAEDIMGRVPAALRFAATLSSGLIFCLLTGETVTRLEIPYVDNLMQIHLISLAVTVFAIAGLANAINIIDGFNGLAVGSIIIMLSAVTLVSLRVGDHDLVLFIGIVMAVSFGFLLVNFPLGFVFLGDGGAYFLGFLLAVVSVLLLTRNPDVSPWVTIVILAYPLIETLFSIMRRTLRRGHSPDRPDRLHLHSVVYQKVRKHDRGLVNAELDNSVTGFLMWTGPVIGFISVMFIPYSREGSLPVILLQIVVYALVYYRVARVRPDG